MAHFLDGPAAGRSLMLKLAPLLLRVVTRGEDELDALDQPEDEPNVDERVQVYHRVTEIRPFHLLARGKHRRTSGWYQDADYVLARQQPADHQVRTSAAWAAWCKAHEGRFWQIYEQRLKEQKQ